MSNVIELKAKKGEKLFLVEKIGDDAKCIYELMNDDNFYQLINKGEVNWEITYPVITKMHHLEGWAIGLETVGETLTEDSHVTLNCMMAGSVRMYESIDKANSALMLHGLGNSRIYNHPVNSSIENQD